MERGCGIITMSGFTLMESFLLITLSLAVSSPKSDFRGPEVKAQRKALPPGTQR